MGNLKRTAVRDFSFSPRGWNTRPPKFRIFNSNVHGLPNMPQYPRRCHSIEKIWNSNSQVSFFFARPTSSGLQVPKVTPTVDLQNGDSYGPDIGDVIVVFQWGNLVPLTDFWNSDPIRDNSGYADSFFSCWYWWWWFCILKLFITRFRRLY